MHPNQMTDEQVVLNLRSLIDIAARGRANLRQFLADIDQAPDRYAHLDELVGIATREIERRLVRVGNEAIASRTNAGGKDD